MHPLGLVAQPHADRPRLELRNCASAAASTSASTGTRLPCTTTEKTTTTTTIPYSRVAPRDVRRQQRDSQQDRHGALQSPASSTKPRSFGGQPRRDEAKPDQQRANDEAPSAAPSTRPGTQTFARESTDRSTVSPSATNATISAEARERRVETLDLALVRGLAVTDQDPRDEDGKKSRPAGERRQGVEREHAHQRPQRIQRLARAAARLRMKASSSQPPATPIDRADSHLQHELAEHVQRRAAAQAARRDQARHERDADRVVRARLALEDGAGPAGDLAAAEHGEDDRRIGRRDGRGEQGGGVPGQAEARSARAPRRRATVRNVPSTPTTAMGVADALKRRQPMCMPPSKRIASSATVTSRSTVRSEGACRLGIAFTAMAAATSSSAGAGIFSHSVSRWESTAAMPTAANTSTAQGERHGVAHGAVSRAGRRTATGMADPQPTRLPGAPMASVLGGLAGARATFGLMCRSIKTLRPPYVEAPTEEEMAAAALQYVRKISGMRAPAKANIEAFDQAVQAVTEATRELLGSLEIRRRPVAAAD